MKPRLSFLGFSLFALVYSCGSPALITSSWHKRDLPPTQYDNVFVAAITHDLGDKQTIEKDVQAQLQQKGVTVEKSIDVFPPRFTQKGPVAQNVQMSQIAATGAKGLLIITIERVEKERRFRSVAPWEPVGDAYIAIHPDAAYDPNFQFDGFYSDMPVYVVETRFYDTQTKKLIWGAESKTYAPHDINGLATGYLDRIYPKMLKDGVMVASLNH